MNKAKPTGTKRERVRSGRRGAPQPKDDAAPAGKVGEIGGRKGPDPTRYGDWEKNGRCIDF